MRAERAAAQQPSGRQREAPPEAVYREGLDGIARAARIEAARGETPGRHPLVGRQQGDRRTDRQAEVGGATPSRADRRAGSLQCGGHIGTQRGRRPLCRSWLEPDEKGPPRQRPCLGVHDRSGPAAERVPHNGGPTASADCIADLGKYSCRAVLGRDEGGLHGTAGRPGPGALQRREGSAGRDPSDRPCRHATPQTVSRWRPLSRRDFRMARPARVDMRLRKPWVRARLRVLG